MPTRVYIPTEPYTPTGESMYAQPAPDNALLAPPEQQGALSRGINRLLGTQFGEERYQTWPEKMIRSAATLAGDVVSGAVPVLPPGSRREDFTDEPAPGVDSNAPWWKVSRWVPPVAAQPNDVMMERAQDLAGVAMGGGIGGTGKATAAGEAVLGSGPVRKMRYDALPEDMQTLLHDYMGERTVPDLPVSTIKVAEIPEMKMPTRERGPEHAMRMDLNETPPVVTAHGEFLDGRHRTYAARQRGVEELPVIDLSAHMTPEMARKESMGKVLRSDSQAGTGIQAVKNAPAWYSAVEHALEQSTTGAAPGAQWLATLRNSRGVKPEEMAWLGLDDYLAAAQLEGRKVTRAELQDYVRSHAVELRDVQKGQKSVRELPPEERAALEKEFERELNFKPEDEAHLQEYYDSTRGGMSDNTKYHDYQLPGGENYREHLITLPSKNINDRVRAFAEKEGINDISEAYAQYEARHGSKLTGDNYKSSHWDEPNILAHVRTNDRVIDGKKSLHLEEVQSDWHQQGRDKGYKSEMKVTRDGDRYIATGRNGQEIARGRVEDFPSEQAFRDTVTPGREVPDAPFKKSWHELALKRMLRRAAEEGYERLSWTPGDAQAARYDLSKHMDTLAYQKNGDKYQLVGNKDGRSVFSKTVSKDELADTVGKDVAKRIVDDQGKERLGRAMRYLEGLDLKVGGEGMRGFYDEILPKALQKIGREHGVKVQRGGVETKSITKTVDDRYSVTGDPKIYSTLEEARKAASEPIFYIDIPQSLRDAAMRRGFPLFSGGKMFVPHQEEDK